MVVMLSHPARKHKGEKLGPYLFFHCHYNAFKAYMCRKQYERIFPDVNNLVTSEKVPLHQL